MKANFVFLSKRGLRVKTAYQMEQKIVAYDNVILYFENNLSIINQYLECNGRKIDMSKSGSNGKILIS